MPNKPSATSAYDLVVIGSGPAGRRAAVQSGAAQLFGAALGPLLASVVVSDRNIHGALYLGAGLLLTGLAMIAGLHFTARRSPAA